VVIPKFEKKAVSPIEISPGELKILRKQKIINITAYVHFALQWELQNYGEKSLDISAFSKRWDIPLSSTYRAFETLERRGWIRRSRHRDSVFRLSEEFA
jgi:DNA-binding MarR family transcriptional regulator